MKKLLLPLFALLITCIAQAQNVGIGTTTPAASAQLDVTSTTKGLLIPRMTAAQRDAVANPATGLMIYQTDNIPGIYLNSGTSGSPLWVMAGNGSYWSLTGNTGTNPTTHFIGTTDNVPLVFRVNNQPAGKIDHLLFNTSWGYHSLLSNTTGIYNTAHGAGSLYSNTSGTGNCANGLQALMMNTTGNYNTTIGTNALYSNRAGSHATAVGAGAMYFSNSTLTPFDNTNVAVGFEALRGSADASANTGNWNTATGYQSLWSNAAGIHNTASGHGSLYANTTGNFNTANGSFSLYANTTGNNNSAYGFGALWANTTGGSNSASGYQALYLNSTGSYNTAYGYAALNKNLTGDRNTATGFGALLNNSTGYNNTSTGFGSLYYNTTGYYNTADGFESLNANIIGNHNTANGYRALYSNITGSFNTAIGDSAGTGNTDGQNNTYIGANTSGTPGLTNATAIGANAQVTQSNSLVLGNNANVGIGTATPDTSAQLDVNSTSKGFLTPRMTAAQRTAIFSPANGLLVYQTDNPSGFYFFKGSVWTMLSETTSYPNGTATPVLTICCQSWMTKNLDVNRYRNGDPIPKVTDNAAWAALSTGAYCYYNNDSATYSAIYGKLYNWYAVNDPRGLAPEGWHVPTDFEWTTLENCLGGASVAGGPMKETGTTHWVTPNTGATNSSGFTGLPGGGRSDDGTMFVGVGYNFWGWSSTENGTLTVWFRNLQYNLGDINRNDYGKRFGFSVRCLRD